MPGLPVPSGRGKAAAVLGLVAVAGGAVVLSGGGTPQRPPLPPWEMPAVSGILGDRPWRSALDLRGPALLVYVDLACPACRVELQRLREMPDAARSVWLVTGPGRDTSGSDVVPRALRHRLVRDVHGQIARTLGIGAVPTTFGIDAAGVVRLVRVGASRAGEFTRDLASLRRPPATEAR